MNKPFQQGVIDQKLGHLAVDIADDFFEQTNNFSAIDLAGLSQAERQKLWQEYQENFNGLSEDHQLQYLEQFILIGEASDDDCLSLINDFSEEQKAELGKFFTQAVKAEKFIKSFFACWYYIDPVIAYDLRRQAARGELESAIHLAPFIDLSNEVRLADNVEKTSKNSKKLLDFYFHYFEDFDLLLQSIIAYCDQQKALPEADRVYYKVRENLLALPYEYVWPHFEYFYDLGILTVEDFKNAIAKSNFILESRESNKFLTKQEADRVAEIIDYFKKRYPQKQDIDTLLFYGDMAPLDLNYEYLEILAQASLRAASLLTKNFDSNIQHLDTDALVFLANRMDEQYPVMAFMEDFGLTNKQIKNLTLLAEENYSNVLVLKTGADLQTLLDYAHSQPDGGEELEKIIADFLINDLLRHQVYGYFGFVFKDSVPKIISSFQTSVRDKLLKTIDKFAPGLWLKSLDFSLKEGLIDLDLIFSDFFNNEDLLDNYFIIIDNFNLLEPVNKYSVEDFKSKIRIIIRQEPSLLFVYNRIAADLFTPEQMQGIISKNIRESGNAFLIYKIIKNDQVLDIYKEDIRQAVFDNLEVYVEVVNMVVDSALVVGKIFSKEEIFELTLKVLDRVDLEAVLSNYGMIEYLCDDKERFDLLVEKLSQLKLYSQLVVMVKIFDKYIKREEDKRKQLKSNSFFNQKSSDDKKEITQEINKLAQDQNYQKTKQFLLTRRPKLFEILNKACQENRFLCFDREILRLYGNLQLSEYIERDLEDYIPIKPDILFEKDGVFRGDYLLTNVLGRRKYIEILEKWGRLAAFRRMEFDQPVFQYKYLEPEFKIIIEGFNPLISLEAKWDDDQASLERDYYQLCLAQLEKMDFFHFYGGRLEKIAQAELNNFGPRLRLAGFRPRSEFIELSDQVMLFESSPHLKDNWDFIVGLNPEQRHQLFNWVKFVLLNMEEDSLGAVFKEPDFDSVISGLQGLVRKYTADLFELEDIKGIDQEGLDLKAIEPLITFYIDTCRSNYGLKKSFQEFIRKWGRGQYAQWRFWGETDQDSPPNYTELLEKLKAEALVPANITIEQYQIWTEEAEYDFEEAFDYNIGDFGSALADIIRQAVANNHIDQEKISTANLNHRYYKVFGPLDELTKEQKAIKNNHRQSSTKEKSRYQEIQRQIADYREQHAKEMDEIMALRYLEALPRMSLEDIKFQMIGLDEKNKVKLNKVFAVWERVFSEFPDFIQDIQRIRKLIEHINQQLYGDENISRSKLNLTDRLDLNTYIRIGERPVNSCQNYHSRSGLNGGLMSYLADPQVKIIQLYNEQGDIIARSIMRLMSDDAGQPYLFLEDVYSVNPHHKIKEAILNFGKKKAKSMGIDLCALKLAFASNQQDDQSTAVNLYNYASRSPYIYTDSGNGLIRGGKFIIKSIKL